ncbi:hypothetical protein MSNKSG1_09933 [Marinobacter santoriniensis NKSG1]|uniref:DUF2244 domain-containing protein n=1 Tax=Marinobacter santoriniensis NKSG1 TaxID=1288826 RepID=M7CSQ5_9GAMM|nr:DUF2244 domain-containing protein [Marinobacter santoriniensis]EMP56184.1 hypothetical protein MSNKSG1_09933 [Marinobacter santoriniensis NKSG1]
MVERLRYPGGLRLLLTPNRSLSWRGNVRIWVLLALISGVIAGGWALVGVWLILPFAGLELIGVAAGIYVTSRNCQRKEVVTIEGDTIHIEAGISRKEHDWTLPIHNTRLESFPPNTPFDCHKVRLTNRQQQIPLGDFLNNADTDALVHAMKARGINILQRQEQPTVGIWF